MQFIVEILAYTLKPGTGGAFFAIMRDSSVPLHQASGIDVVWHGQSRHDPDGYGLIRAFPSMDLMEASLAAFYGSDAWRSGPREAIIASIETSTRVCLPLDVAGIAAIRASQDYTAGQKS